MSPFRFKLGKLLCRVGLHRWLCIWAPGNRYYVCRRYGCQARWVQPMLGGYQPIDQGWVETGTWSGPRRPPNSMMRGRSGVSRP